MPESIKQRMNVLGKRNKQGGQLKFANRRNVKFDWSLNNKLTPLIRDNTIEQEASYPGIPSNMTGVLTEEQVPVLEELQITQQ